MDPKEDRGQNEPVQRMGIAGDLGRLKRDGAASADELRDFIKGMHGKSPQEVLGSVAQSGLVQSTLLSAVGVLVLMTTFTVVPYAWGKIGPTQEQMNRVPIPAPTADKNDSKTDAATQPAVAKSKNDKSSDSSNTGQPNVKKARSAMGIGETKTGEPDIDNLLDKKFKD